MTPIVQKMISYQKHRFFYRLTQNITNIFFLDLPEEKMFCTSFVTKSGVQIAAVQGQFCLHFLFSFLNSSYETDNCKINKFLYLSWLHKNPINKIMFLLIPKFKKNEIKESYSVFYGEYGNGGKRVKLAI